jgi:endonuclease/exonuclease/phosphatase family metal-dependent hydrolase
MKITTRFLLVALLLVSGLHSYAQKRVVGAIGFYNVENLFDIEDDPETNDREFLPDSPLQWDAAKYDEKLSNISKVLSTMANGADIIGLAEIENLTVLQDLVATRALAKFKYQIVHKNSPDKRGVEVAMIYKEGKFKPIHNQWLRYPDPSVYTRDILLSTGIYFGDTLTIAVNHWPSRLGGGEDRRNTCGALLRKAVDSIRAKSPNTKIIIMGDLNDDPRNASVKKHLGAVDSPDKVPAGGLFNPSAIPYKQGIGTLAYRGTWNLFDQIIISDNLVKGDGITYKPNSFSIFGPDWMRVQTGDNRGAPWRMIVGGKYIGGFSDHFPVYILIEK